MKYGKWITGAAFAALAWMGGTREALAQFAIGGDFQVGLPVNQTTLTQYLSTGAGFDLRLGYRIRVPYQPLFVTPELVAGYMDLSSHVVRVRPGVRIAFGRLFMGYAYGHMGYGWTSYDTMGTVDRTGTAPFASAGGLSLDVGGGIDFAVLRRLTVGANLGYNVVGVGAVDTAHPDWRAKWLNIGLNATFYL